MAPRTLTATTAVELREMLMDKTARAELLEDGDKFSEFVDRYKKVTLSKDPGIEAQVREQTEAFMVNWLKDHSADERDAVAKRLNLDNPLASRAYHQNEIYNSQAVGAPFDKHFAKLSDFVHGISNYSVRDAALAAKLRDLQNALSPVQPADGGFLIPEILRAEIMRVALEKAVVRSRARIIPMDSLTIPFPTIDSSDNSSSIYGGVVGYWTEPGATLTASQPRFGRVNLQAHKLTLYTECPSELLQDARPAMATLLNSIFPEAVAWFEDVAFFLGGGVGEPLGFLNAPGGVSVTRSTTVAGNNVEWVDIVNMYSRMLPSSLSSAVWICSPDVLPSLLTMLVASGTNAVLLGGSNYASGSVAPPMSILGAPLIVSEKAATVGAAGDINFVDFGQYLLGDRQALSARQSDEFKFDSDSTAFRVIERVDGRPWLANAITPMNGSSNTLSPYVKLAAA